MLTFMSAYLLVWFAVLAYLLRLDARGRRLERTLDALQRRAAQSARLQQPVEDMP